VFHIVFYVKAKLSVPLLHVYVRILPERQSPKWPIPCQVEHQTLLTHSHRLFRNLPTKVNYPPKS